MYLKYIKYLHLQKHFRWKTQLKPNYKNIIKAGINNEQQYSLFTHIPITDRYLFSLIPFLNYVLTFSRLKNKNNAKQINCKRKVNFWSKKTSCKVKKRKTRLAQTQALTYMYYTYNEMVQGKLWKNKRTKMMTPITYAWQRGGNEFDQIILRQKININSCHFLALVYV